MSDRELIVDSDDTYSDTPNVIFVHPEHLDTLRYTQPNSFSGATIRNCPVSKIKTSIIMGMYSSLKQNAKVEIVVYQPIEVMQEYDARTIEAYAKLAGFDDIKTSTVPYVDPASQKQLETLCVSFVKPKKRVVYDNENILSGNVSVASEKEIVSGSNSNTDSGSKNNRSSYRRRK